MILAKRMLFVQVYQGDTVRRWIVPILIAVAGGWGLTIAVFNHSPHGLFGSTTLTVPLTTTPTVTVPVAPLLPKPYLRDVTGRVRIGYPPTNATRQIGFTYGQRLIKAGATSLIYSRSTGRLLGAYVDDDQPHGRRQEVALLKSVRRLHPHLLVAGQAPGYRIIHLHHILDAYEFYPYGNMPVRYWLPLPRTGAYIVQRYFAFPNERPPTYRQYLRILHIVERLHPKLIWTY